MKIPQIIKVKAAEQGYNSIEYIGMREGAQAFSVGLVDDSGLPLPTGMPVVYLLKGAEITVRHGLEALDLL